MARISLIYLCAYALQWATMNQNHEVAIAARQVVAMLAELNISLREIMGTESYRVVVNVHNGVFDHDQSESALGALMS